MWYVRWKVLGRNKNKVRKVRNIVIFNKKKKVRLVNSDGG